MTRLLPEGQVITVTSDGEDAPITFKWKMRRHDTQTIINHWRMDILWEESRIWRDYFTLLTNTGLKVTLVHDLLTDSWYLHELFD
ncbi:MAG: hypothetical protein L0332_24390 [Chloroflexi bacterium]|nr:hypothetical protein [Chloroflexota bacterium]MCI0649922.1 hypothetical protein [Chloroflexota bacterium]MCI0729835.1 hypothetical protein [Chloroflexota bacterium]